MDHHEQSDERLTLATEAARRVARMKTADVDERREFIRWLTHSPENVREALLAHATDLELREFFRKRMVDATTSPGSKVVELRPPQPLVAQERSRLWNWKRPAGIAAAVVLSVLVAATAFLAYRPDPDVYATTANERRTVVLPDQSLILLKAGSRVRVSFSAQQRDVYLLDGQALFSVASDRAKPFRVQVGTNVVQAVGTKFDVQRLADHCEVAVLEGVVQVANETTGTHPTQVAAGEGVSIAVTGSITVPASIDIERVRAWRLLVYRDKPLAEVAAEFARLNPKPKPQLRVEGAKLQAWPVNGRFEADNPEELADYVAQTDSTVAIERKGDEIVIKPRTDSASPSS